MTRSNPKNYNYDRIWKRYRVTKTFEGKKISYGTYATEEEAQKVVSELRKTDWNKKQLPLILEKLGLKPKNKLKV